MGEHFSVIKRFLDICLRYPERPACAGVTYGEASRIVCGLSRRIKGERVAIFCRQGSSAYFSMLASLHSGSTYAPINLDASVERLRLIVESFKPTDVVVDDIRDLEGIFETLDGLNIITYSSSICSDLDTPTATSLPAYVIFTSGSTGAPKGVVISRSAMDHFVGWGIGALKATPLSRFSQHPNIGFDLSVFDIFVALCSGSELIPLISPLDRMFPARFIEKNLITHWISVPSLVDLMARDREVSSDCLRSLECMAFCGEPLLERHLEYVFRLNGAITVLNTYGPTEATVCMTAIELSSDNWRDFAASGVTLGEAIDGMSISLVGGNSNEGELFIAGPQVADGYWGRLGDGDSAFRDGGYYTGDWVKLVGNSLYFDSRIDRQIKINGFRLELAEVENVLERLIAVPVACVCVENQICAVIETTHFEVSEILGSLRSLLPSYMIPSYFFEIEEFPRSVNDKIDYKEIDRFVAKKVRTDE